MKIVIDTERKTIEVAKDFKDVYDNQVKLNKKLGKDTDTIMSMLDLSNYKVVSKQTRAVVDKTNANDIDAYMNSVKDTDTENYNEYVALKNSKVKNKNGVVAPISFWAIKKWFYEKYPNRKPLAK